MTSQPAHPWESAQAAEAWRRGAAHRAQTLALATERLLDAAALRQGMRVLDVAAGSGEQTLLIAERIGPGGSILATDISASMLALADDSARQAGLANVTTLVSDASALEVAEAEFDAAICRFGLMFMPDLGQALRRIHRALKPGARLAALVWAARERNPWMDVQIGAQSDIGRPPAAGASVLQALSLGDPGTLETAMAGVGFQQVQTSTIATPRHYASLTEAVSAVQSGSAAQAALRESLTDSEYQRYVSGLQRRLSAFVLPDGNVTLPGEAILAVGTR